MKQEFNLILLGKESKNYQTKIDRILSSKPKKDYQIEVSCCDIETVSQNLIDYCLNKGYPVSEHLLKWDGDFIEIAEKSDALILFHNGNPVLDDFIGIADEYDLLIRAINTNI